MLPNVAIKGGHLFELFQTLLEGTWHVYILDELPNQFDPVLGRRLKLSSLSYFHGFRVHDLRFGIR